ncbi:MAG: HEPN domain-containing protein [Clostridiales bacterium]|jgi:HEPN domain-containing protein|nr:HEPN domain-containing protein [Clostridiales bacterium]
MFDKVEYWLELCDYDLETAKAMRDTGRYLYVGFMCHQVVEKGFKAIIAEMTDEIPPKIHALQRLARIGGIFDDLTETQFDLLDFLMPLQIEARYPEHKDKVAEILSKERCDRLIAETEEMLCWIKRKLEK